MVYPYARTPIGWFTPGPSAGMLQDGWIQGGEGVVRGEEATGTDLLTILLMAWQLPLGRGGE